MSQARLAPGVVPGRLTPHELAATFVDVAPPLDDHEARVAAERIAAVIGCTAFDAGPDRSPFVTEFTVGCAELRPDESPAALLDRASADLDVMA